MRLFLLVLLSQSIALSDVDSVRCEFPWAAVTDWEKNSDPEIEKQNPEKMKFHIDSINREKKTARIIGNVGASDVSMIPGMYALNFIEITPPGGLNLLTIDREPLERDGFFRAVYSRHSALSPLFSGTWIVSQYYGTFEAW